MKVYKESIINEIEHLKAEFCKNNNYEPDVLEITKEEEKELYVYLLEFGSISYIHELTTNYRGSLEGAYYGGMKIKVRG